MSVLYVRADFLPCERGVRTGVLSKPGSAIGYKENYPRRIRISLTFSAFSAASGEQGRFTIQSQFVSSRRYPQTTSPAQLLSVIVGFA